MQQLSTPEGEFPPEQLRGRFEGAGQLGPYALSTRREEAGAAKAGPARSARRAREASIVLILEREQGRERDGGAFVEKTVFLSSSVEVRCPSYVLHQWNV